MTGPLLEPALIEQLGRLVPGNRRTARGPGGGLHRSPFKGASVEFRQHRLYVPGDDARRIDWRVLARTDKPFVREYDDETTRRTLMIVDASGSMAYGRPASKADDAARLAAAFAYVALAAGERAGLLVSRESADEWVAPSAVATQFSRVIHALNEARPAGATAIDATLGRAAERTGRRALMIVISDLMLPADRLRRGLARLRHGRHDVAIIRVQHADETNFPFRGWVRFNGLEGDRPSVAYAPAARNTYLDRAATLERQLREACRATRADFIPHVVGRPIIETVRAVIRRGRP